MGMDRDTKWKLVFDFLKNQGLSLFSLLLVLSLAAGAFALSYAGLKDLASTNGVNPELVWVWPLVLDGAIIVFSVCAFRAGLCGEQTAYPMFLVVLSTLASIGFNILHAPVPEGAYVWSQAALVPRIMASIPPLALFLSFEVMIRQLQSQVRQSHARSRSVESPSISLFQEEPPENPHSDGIFGMGGMLLGVQSPEPVSARAFKAETPPSKFVAEEEPRLCGVEPPKTTAEAKALVIRMCKTGALIEDMAAASNRTPKTVARYLNEAGLSVPKLPASSTEKR